MPDYPRKLQYIQFLCQSCYCSVARIMPMQINNQCALPCFAKAIASPSFSISIVICVIFDVITAQKTHHLSRASVSILRKDSETITASSNVSNAKKVSSILNPCPIPFLFGQGNSTPLISNVRFCMGGSHVKY